ncbi:uncharacterized protein LOC100836034 [Brachypodium distachyon]|uniref:IST1-like protein n=1 Tax=Brachypodium distachyon TaxID=15368 RepID=I1HXF4_BRADI|nr:uncharacterized protein LOC100836034 [Brachypodium distachyon]KQJ93421.1 hypothetical protein BRADI_3g04500v3 [Brachypodium distachyon]KQJ93422.1 hypothetical protein BRADI_3g04500v3 [Brachypodium distachyon]KQJ93423.1 hypothetical protein BRADI_3g04500v3 [Brachypodium distachyon]|eukprot:XP_010233837.1 uncharacterized protein LOC100836034 [Brachypodium distachyon]
MFDSLLNTKFFNKCKHAIKCTRTRLDLVRKKKQAMVKFLKKDVVDLLTNGLESHAFGRMEGLIVEMNQASCYDMIEQYCECIVKQLNNLQKQSECPHEALEAVSTLIFAAARFPDLPELCELRHIFTEKYGTSIEPFVSSEFVQKLQDKSFSHDEKLQMVQNIAEEFELPFNTKAFERKISGVPQNKHELLKKGSFNGIGVEASGRGHKVDRPAGLQRKSKSIPEGLDWKQEVLVKPKDIHVIPDCIGQVGEKSRNNYSDKPNEKKHMNNGVPSLDIKRRNGQKEVKKDDKKGGQSWRELMNAEELDLNGSKKQETSVAKSLQREIKKVVPPYTELKETAKKDNIEKVDGNGYHAHRSHMAGDTNDYWGHADLGLKTLGLEKPGTDSANTLNGKTVNKLPPPPYSKPYRAKSEKSAEEDNISLSNRARHVGESSPSVQDRHQVPEKVVNMRPPYVKPNSNMKSAHETPTYQAANGYRHTGSEATGQQRDGLVEDDAVRPVSVRRKSTKPPAYGFPYDEATNEEKMANQTPGSRTRHSSNRNGPRDDYERRKHASRQNGSASGSDYQTEEDENDNAIDFGNLLPRAPGSHRKHRSRSAHPREGGHDNEERMMDKLLRHYSKKGIDREEHKTRTKSRTPRPRDDQPADSNGERSNREGAPNPPERAISLPTESGSPVAKAKAPAPARSISQPDTSRGNVHPRMPDFDELAARISALKKA